MRKMTILWIISLMLLISVVEAHTITEQGKEGVSIAVYGECVGAFYDMVEGQTINTSFCVKNTGTQSVNVSITYERSSDILNIECSPLNVVLVPEEQGVFFTSLHIDVQSSILSIISVSFQVSATATEYVVDNPVSVGVIASTYIQVGKKACLLWLNVKDQYEQPYDGLDVHMVKDALIYDRSKVGETGTIRYVMAEGVYTFKVYDKGVLKKEVEVSVNSDMNYTIYVMRSVTMYNETFITINVVELVIGAIGGYALKTYEVRRKKKREDVIVWSECIK